MDRRCIIGCFTSEKGLHGLLSGLKEIGIEDNDISIIAVFDKLDHLFGTVLGPLRGADLDNIQKKISHLGFGIDLARNIKNYLTDGGAVAVVACEDYQIEDVIELFNEFSPTLVQETE